MRQRCTTLSILIVTLGLILADGQVSALVSPASTVVQAAGFVGNPQGSSTQLLSETQTPREREEHPAHRHNDQQEHTQNRVTVDHTQDRKQKDSESDSDRLQGDILKRLCSG